MLSGYSAGSDVSELAVADNSGDVVMTFSYTKLSRHLFYSLL